MKFLLAWLFLLFAVVFVGAQNNGGGVVISIVSPSTGANLMGVLSVDVTVSAPVTSLTAKLNKSGVLDPVATSPLTKSGNDHWIAVMPLPTVTVSTGYSVTVSDGTSAAIRAFNVVPGSEPVPPRPPTGDHQDILAVLSVMQMQMQKGFAQLAPMPTPQGVACQTVSASTMRADGRYTVTMACPASIAPTAPAKGVTVTVLPQSLSSGTVVK
jgi:hypothetical protein